MDDLDRKIRDSKNCIEESNTIDANTIYQKALEEEIQFKKKTGYEQEKIRLLKFNLLFKGCVSVLLLIFIIVVSISILTPETPSIINNIIDFETINGDEPAFNFSSSEDVKSFIDRTYTNGVIYKEDLQNDFLDQEVELTSDSLAILADYRTNVQEEEVDESDIVKVVGDYIYYLPRIKYSYQSGGNTLNQYRLSIFKEENNKLRAVKTLYFENEVKDIINDDGYQIIKYEQRIPQDLYATEDYVIVRCTSQNQVQIKKDNKLILSNNEKKCTSIQIINTHTLEVQEDLIFPGSNVSTRLINNQLYVVNVNNDSLLNDFSPTYIPLYYLNSTSISIDASRIFAYPSKNIRIDCYVDIYRITLGKSINIDDLHLLSSRVNNIYVTSKNIYLLNTYSTVQENDENDRTEFSATKIYIINIENEMYCDGTITVKGNINDKYWIDEYNGFIRIASTGTKYKYKMLLDKYSIYQSSEVFNYLTIFKKNGDGKYKEISSIKEGIGKVGETLKSARLDGERGTLVTFRNIDPLYVIDLSDHYKPKIVSEYEVEGYSAYQYAYQDNYILGFGYNSTSTQQYKVALFDVSNHDCKQVGDDIKFLNNFLLFDVLNEPKTLFVDKENSLFGFSLEKRDKIQITDFNSGTIHSSYEYYYDFFLIQVNLKNNNPLRIVKTISFNTSNSSYPPRMVFIGDNYYLLTSKVVQGYKFINDEFIQESSLEIK